MGPYELVQKLGAGGMAEVWMGRRMAMGGAAKSVAIKLLASHHMEKPEYRQMFMEEARLSMLLTNSNIVQVFDVGEHDGVAFMAMEWVDGCDLAELTQRLREHGQRLSNEVIAFIIGEVLRALRYAHELTHQGSDSTIVHRDISPQNVMLSISGEVKLMDFGVARVAADETSGQFVKGKLRYMPPEQLRGNSREPTVDLFAVGAMLHELLDGQKFRSTAVDEGDLYGMILAGTYPPLSVDPGEVPIELDQLRWGLLASRVEDRLPSARAALGRLRKWPHYRDASMALEELVRWAVGAEAPRTGLGVPEPPSGGGTVVLHQAAIWGQEYQHGQGYGPPDAPGWGPEHGTSRDPRHERSETNQTPIASATGSHAYPAHDGTGSHAYPNHNHAGYGSNSGLMVPQTDAERPVSRAHPVVAEGRSSLTTILLPILLVVVALGFGLFAAGMFLGWFGGDDDDASADAVASEQTDAQPEATSPEVAEPNTPPPEGSEKAEELPLTPPPEPELILDDEPDTGEPKEGLERALELGPNGKPQKPATEGAGGSTGSSKHGTSTGDGSKKKKPTTDAGPKVSVTLLTSQYDQVDVKIGGVVTSLSKKKNVEIPIGTHQILLREGDGDWKSAGKITVEADKRYQVTLIKPPLAMVKTL